MATESTLHPSSIDKPALLAAELSTDATKKALVKVNAAGELLVSAGGAGPSGALSEADFDTKTGALTETAPATDTASSGLNGRLQRIAQRLTSLIAVSPAANAASLAVTATGAAAAGVTLTLPAAGAGLFHYITRIEIVRFATAALTAAATPVVVTTTNLPGSIAYSLAADAAAQGTTNIQNGARVAPLKSSAANTATTIVCPATTNVIWRVNAEYYTGA